MKKIIFTLPVLFLSLLTYGQQQSCKEVIISEYMDGPMKNKVIELYNTSNDTIDLIGYSILVFQNGAPTPLKIFLSGKIAPKETHVVAHPQADNDILAKAHQTDVKMNFDGNDAVVLNKGQSSYIDKIGEIGVDPGQGGWAVPPSGSTKASDLRRKLPIDKGETDWLQGKMQWDVFPADSAQNIKIHENVCSADEVFEFSESSSTYDESDGTAIHSIEVKISSGGHNTATQLLISTAFTSCNGQGTTATNNYDYDISSTTLDFPAFQYTAEMDVVVYDDDEIESDEYVCFKISINYGSGYINQQKQTHLLKIKSDDLVGIKELNPDGKIKIYPNPANEFLQIKKKQGEHVKQLSITNSLGQEVAVYSVQNTESLKFNISNLPEGMYFVTILTDENTERVKFIKK